MHYDDMIIEASAAELVRAPDKRRLGRFKVSVVASPAGEIKPEAAVPVEYDYGELQSSLRGLEKRKLERDELVALGRTLALLLLPPQGEGAATGVRELLAASLNEIGHGRGLRLRLLLPPLLAALPWEYLYVDRAGGGDGMDGFLALDPRVAIVRHEALPAPAPQSPVTGNIKVVAALASSLDLPPLDLEREKAALEQAFSEQAGIEPLFLQDATLDEIQAAIPGAGVFHFAGHGLFNRRMGDLPGTYTGTSALALDDGYIEAEQLGINLRGNGVRLAVLGGCETGRRDGVSVWSGVAPALVKAEVPAVIANQFSIWDTSAIAFSGQFYRALVGGLSIERAVSAGRIAAYNADPEGRDWGVPVLYLRAADGRLFGGASDKEVRQQAQTAAEADVSVRVKEVVAGGEVLGAEVGEMLSGKLGVTVNVAGVVYGKVVGAAFGRLGGGQTRVETSVDTVESGGSVTGVKIDTIGGGDYVAGNKIVVGQHGQERSSGHKDPRESNRLMQEKIRLEEPRETHPTGDERMELQVYEALNTGFSLEELRDLYFRLSVDWDSVPGANKPAKARELVQYFVRRNQLVTLVNMIRVVRPELGL